MIALVKKQLKDEIDTQLDDANVKKLYLLTGLHSIRELEKKVNIPRSTISDIWKRWEQLGLIIKDGQQYRKTLQ